MGFNSIKVVWNNAKMKFDDDPYEYEFVTPLVNIHNLFFYDYKLSFELIGQIKYLDGLNNKYIDVKLGHLYEVTKVSATLYYEDKEEEIYGDIYDEIYMGKEKIFDSKFMKDFGLLQYGEDPLPSDSRFNEEII